MELFTTAFNDIFSKSHLVCFLLSFLLMKSQNIRIIKFRNIKNINNSLDSMWFSYKLIVWIFLPALMSLNLDIYPTFRHILIFHLASTLIKILINTIKLIKSKEILTNFYISYPIVHALGLSLILLSTPWLVVGKLNQIVLIFIIILILGNLCESVIALIYKKEKQQAKKNMSSNDATKYRKTLVFSVILFFYFHLIFQSYIL